jgi:hypothetical protein
MSTVSSPYTLPPTTENAPLILNEAYRNALTTSNLTAHSKANNHWLNVAPHLHCCFCHITPAAFARQFPDEDNLWYEKPVHNQSIVMCSKCITGPWIVTSPHLWGIAKNMRLKNYTDNTTLHWDTHRSTLIQKELRDHNIDPYSSPIFELLQSKRYRSSSSTNVTTECPIAPNNITSTYPTLPDTYDKVLTQATDYPLTDRTNTNELHSNESTPISKHNNNNK